MKCKIHTWFIGQRIALTLLLLFSAVANSSIFTIHFYLSSCRAQEVIPADNSAEIDRKEIQSRIQQMTDDLKQIYVVTQMMPSAGYEEKVKMPVAKVIADRLKVADRAMKQLDFRWNAYYQTIQPDIAEDDELIAMAADFQQTEQSVKDSLSNMIGRSSLLIAFCEAEVAIPASEHQYKQLFNEAMQLSLVAKLAPQLEKLKGREALLFSEIQAHYDKAKEATAAMPRLQQRMDVIDQHFIVLKNTSEKIQAAEYKPLLQRAKDWLMGLAAVAILMMFTNMMVAKIQAFKKTRENMKKMKEMMNGGNNQIYPTI